MAPGILTGFLIFSKRAMLRVTPQSPANAGPFAFFYERAPRRRPRPLRSRPHQAPCGPSAREARTARQGGDRPQLCSTTLPRPHAALRVLLRVRLCWQRQPCHLLFRFRFGVLRFSLRAIWDLHCPSGMQLPRRPGLPALRPGSSPSGATEEHVLTF